MKIPWHELPIGFQHPYLEKARYLIENNYQYDMSVDALAEQIYKNDTQANTHIRSLAHGMIK